MALLEKALDYIVDIVTENEEVKKFPKDFVTTSMQWIRTWFLVDDPKTEAKLQDPNRSVESKRTLIETKLENLQENPAFMQELTQKLESLEQQKTRLKNVMVKAKVEVDGNVHIGDRGNSSGDDYDEKNVIKDSTIKAGGDFRLGDDIQQGETIINNNYYGTAKPAKTDKAAASSTHSELKTLLAKGKTQEVFDQLLDLTEQQDATAYNTVLLLSGRLNRLNTKEQQNVIGDAQANIERNKITTALMQVIDGLEE